jgi:hypothetical protein
VRGAHNLLSRLRMSATWVCAHFPPRARNVLHGAASPSPFGDMGEEELPREGPATASFSQRLVNGPLTS